MDYAKLKSLIMTMPGYSPSSTDAEVLTWLTTPSVTKPMPYSATVRSLMADLGPTLADSILTKLEAASASDSVVARSLKLLDPAQGGLDLAHPNTRAQLDALVTAGVLAQSDVDALKGLSDRMVTPLEDAGLPEPPINAITRARAY